MNHIKGDITTRMKNKWNRRCNPKIQYLRGEKIIFWEEKVVYSYTVILLYRSLWIPFMLLKAIKRFSTKMTVLLLSNVCHY